MDTIPKSKSNNKICFVSTLFGDTAKTLKKLEPFGKIFEKNEDCDYLFFTDIPKDDIPPTSWDIINVKLESFGRMHKVKVSRIFKFQLHKVFEQMGRNYDIVYYCDSFLYPTFQNDWNKLFDNYNVELPIIQYRHPLENSINAECNLNLKVNKEKKAPLMETLKYLQKLDESVDLNQKFAYCENTTIGFKISDKNVQKFLDDFWKIYTEIPSFRDQPPWNYMYLSRNMQPIINNKFRERFKGKKNVCRNVTDYYS